MNKRFKRLLVGVIHKVGHGGGVLDTIELVRLAIPNAEDEVAGTVGCGDVGLGSSKSLEWMKF